MSVFLTIWQVLESFRLKEPSLICGGFLIMALKGLSFSWTIRSLSSILPMIIFMRMSIPKPFF